MLTLTLSEERTNNCFQLTNSSNNSCSISLITENSSLICLSNSSNKGFDSCSFYSGPSEASILAFNENSESCGIIASNTTYSDFGSYSGGSESCGIIASTSGFSASSSSFSTSCNYSC